MSTSMNSSRPMMHDGRQAKQPLVQGNDQIVKQINRSLDIVYKTEDIRSALLGVADWLLAAFLAQGLAFYVFGMDGIITRGTTVVLIPLMHRPARQMMDLGWAFANRFYQKKRKATLNSIIDEVLSKSKGSRVEVKDTAPPTSQTIG